MSREGGDGGTQYRNTRIQREREREREFSARSRDHLSQIIEKTECVDTNAVRLVD